MPIEATCRVCRRSISLADRNGRHVASEAHYPHRDASGTMTCTPLTHVDRAPLTVDVVEPSPRVRVPLRLVPAVATRKLAPT
jgi:hypothetical protein